MKNCDKLNRQKLKRFRNIEMEFFLFSPNSTQVINDYENLGRNYFQELRADKLISNGVSIINKWLDNNYSKLDLEKYPETYEELYVVIENKGLKKEFYEEIKEDMLKPFLDSSVGIVANDAIRANGNTHYMINYLATKMKWLQDNLK